MLECFTVDRLVLGISELAEMLGISRSTSHRYATTLVQLGFLEQDTKRRYRLASGAVRAGATVIETVRREIRARAILEDLRTQTGHTVSLGLLSGLRVIYVYRLSAHGVGQYEADGELRGGALFPAPETPIGMALLSTLLDSELLSLLATSEPGLVPLDVAAGDEQGLIGEVKRIRESGVAVGQGAHGTAWSVAAPVIRWIDRPILAVELTVPTGTPNIAERFSGLVKHTAKLISV